MGNYSVAVETDSPRLDDDQLGALLEALESAPEVTAVSVGIGGPRAPGAAAQIGVTAPTPAGAADSAARVFVSALEAVAGESPAVARVDVMTEAYEDRWLNEEPETYVGVAEVAGMLRVSKSRVSELRGRRGFPAPVAELAAGPVWRRSSLERFLGEWDRRPGRPSSASA